MKFTKRGVRYWFDTFKHLRSFDILDYQDGKWKDVNTIQTICATHRTISKVVQKKENQKELLKLFIIDKVQINFHVKNPQYMVIDL